MSTLETPQDPQPDLAREIGVESLYFKREDLHPLGSHKGRSIPHMIDTYRKAGWKHFAVSSSGNAALAAALYVKGLNEKVDPITLEIFAGKKINAKKLAKLQALKSEHILVSIQDRPLQTLFVKTKDPSIKSLRQSTNDTALVGYESLAKELAQIPDLQAIFIGTSSGTTAQALAEYFLKNPTQSAGKKTGHFVEIHIVQTPSCHPMVNALAHTVRSGTVAEVVGVVEMVENKTDEISIADAIVDRTAERRNTLVPLIEKTGGAGWIVDNEAIRIAEDLTKKHGTYSRQAGFVDTADIGHTGLVISPNSALSVAGLMNAVYTGRTWKGSVVCMICGE